MKTILVPTDFSSASIRAIEYAVQFAKHVKCELIFFHVYSTSLLLPSLPLLKTEMKEKADAELEAIKKKMVKKFDFTGEIHCATANGFATTKIRKYAESQNVDLIIMGMSGMSALEEKLFGNTTTTIMESRVRPILVIGRGVKFCPLANIGLAYNYSRLENIALLHPLTKITRIFKASLYVIHVVPLLEKNDQKEIEVHGARLKKYFKDLPYTFYKTSDLELMNGIKRFVKSTEIDMLAIIPGHHSIISSFISQPFSKRMAFHSKIPILVL